RGGSAVGASVTVIGLGHLERDRMVRMEHNVVFAERGRNKGVRCIVTCIQLCKGQQRRRKEEKV
ncbi:hypothetical protein A2U01_0051395, partial [Trifolium medium]|nr:hypothetical protein [Trifolium medium]